MPTRSLARRRTRTECRLQAPGWTAETRRALERLIVRGADKKFPVVFDFDNTIVRGDIGEATFAVLVRSGVLKSATLPASLCPAFEVPHRGRISLEACQDLTEYYEALLAPTAHGAQDPTPLATGYAWVVQIMENLPLGSVVEATRKALQWSEPANPGFIEVMPGKTAYPVPVFYPEMVELLAQFLQHEFDVWIFSASNVWSVRWMVLNALNPMLCERGAKTGILPQHIIGVSTLLADTRGRLYKDSVLVQEAPAYMRLGQGTLKQFSLTRWLHFPVPTYAGKVAAIFDALGREPYLAAGDSPGDHAMMTVSRHRLWVARLEKPRYQEEAWNCLRRTGGKNWIVQPTLTRHSGMFVTEPGSLARTLRPLPPNVRESLRFFRQMSRDTI
jgi:hypothetical protein